MPPRRLIAYYMKMCGKDTTDNDQPRFLCDAMLGGLARWLRAAGYDAEFHYGIEDRTIVRQAEATGQVLLSSDGPMFERNVIKKGQVRALYIPQQLSKFQQLLFVLRELNLPMLGARCMSCGGELVEVPRHEVSGEAPPLAYRNCSQFWRCSRCGKLLWHGTHWQKINRKLSELTASQDPGPPPARPSQDDCGNSGQL